MKVTYVENVDIHQIIDDAMTHKDRTVSVFISNIGTTINVTPLDENELCWIPETYENVNGPIVKWLFCPKCGYKEYTYKQYCANCGEKLKLPKEENDV